MDIAFTINRLALRGLGTTLTSLVRNCSDSRSMTLLFLCAGLRERYKQNISRLLVDEQFQGEVRFIDFNAKATFGHLPSLHGDWTAYGRLLIPLYVQAATCVYLDADLIVLLDIASIQHVVLQNNLVAATNSSTVAKVLDCQLFIKQLAWSPDSPYFNSGVLVFNIKKWRQHNIDEVWRAFAGKYSINLLSHDQSILNAIYEGKFTHLPEHFNNTWFSGNAEPMGCKKSILHFAGSPKPWDLLGRLLHRGYKTWINYQNAYWEAQYSNFSIGEVVRYWKIRRSIIRTLLARQFFGKWW